MPRSVEANQKIREEQRANILSAAMKVFACKGSNATMAEVAAEAGISQGLAYRYFPSKEEILATLVREAAQSGGGPSARVSGIQGTPGERLEHIISYILEDRRERPLYYQFIYQLLADENIQSDLRQTVSENGGIIQEELRKLIVQGQSTGEIAKGDPDQLMTALMACINGLVKWMSSVKPETVKDHFPDTKIILRMLKPDQNGGPVR